MKSWFASKLQAIVALLFASVLVPAAAQDAPRVGLAYNLSEVHSLTYSCLPPSGGLLSCEFVQTSVRPKATFADLPAALDKAKKEFAQGQSFSADDCKMNQTLSNILEGKEKPPKEDALEKMSTLQRRDMLALTKAILKACAGRSEADYLDLIRLGQDRDRRTCKVSANSFKQSFRQAPAGAAGTIVWLAESKPEGPCGVVQLSRFESERTSIGTATFTNWRFIARKAITNPTGELLPGASCSRFDERSYTYDWRSQEQQLSCDYIEFSPL